MPTPSREIVLADINTALADIKAAGDAHYRVRQKYLNKLHEKTGRNVIAYYSAWLQKPELQRQVILGISDIDKDGLMSVIRHLDRPKGLDLILHTPGGSMGATESIVDYLRSMFHTNIRAIIPQIAMSGGTMLALACKEVLMGKHSSIGPIDPQINGMPAHGIVEEFETAAKEIKEDPAKAPIWQAIIANYSPTLIGECEKAIQWSEEVTKNWLRTGMFDGDENANDKIDKIMVGLSEPELTKFHSRQVPMQRAKELGIAITALEDDQKLQEAVLLVHHVFMQTLEDSTAFKIIENHIGATYILDH